MRRTIIGVLVAIALAESAFAQIPVSDPGNLTQAILIAERTRREYQALIAQYHMLLRMSRPLETLAGYRLPGVPSTAHDPMRWMYGRAWLQALNVGNAVRTAYEEITRQLARSEPATSRLPDDARRVLEAAYATVEITDAVTRAAGHHVGLTRAYGQRLERAIDALAGDVMSTAPQQHEMTAVLDKVAAAALIGRRQDMAMNQTLSHTVEQLLARSKRLRDTEAAAMNMRLAAMRDGHAASSAIVRGASADLRVWRQP